MGESQKNVWVSHLIVTALELKWAVLRITKDGHLMYISCADNVQRDLARSTFLQL